MIALQGSAIYANVLIQHHQLEPLQSTSVHSNRTPRRDDTSAVYYLCRRCLCRTCLLYQSWVAYWIKGRSEIYNGDLLLDCKKMLQKSCGTPGNSGNPSLWETSNVIALQGSAIYANVLIQHHQPEPLQSTTVHSNRTPRRDNTSDVYYLCRRCLCRTCLLYQWWVPHWIKGRSEIYNGDLLLDCKKMLQKSFGTPGNSGKAIHSAFFFFFMLFFYESQALHRQLCSGIRYFLVTLLVLHMLFFRVFASNYALFGEGGQTSKKLSTGNYATLWSFPAFTAVLCSKHVRTAVCMRVCKVHSLCIQQFDTETYLET